jgi:hypothetical protein
MRDDNHTRCRVKACKLAFGQLVEDVKDYPVVKPEDDEQAGAS